MFNNACLASSEGQSCLSPREADCHLSPSSAGPLGARGRHPTHQTHTLAGHCQATLAWLMMLSLPFARGGALLCVASQQFRMDDGHRLALHRRCVRRKHGACPPAAPKPLAQPFAIPLPFCCRALRVPVLLTTCRTNDVDICKTSVRWRSMIKDPRVPKAQSWQSYTIFDIYRARRSNCHVIAFNTDSLG